jgi:hypothetical protein
VVATDLPGVGELREALGPWLDRVQLPRVERVDVPVAADLPAFVSELTVALRRALEGPVPGNYAELASWTWRSVFERVEGIWSDLLS